MFIISGMQVLRAEDEIVRIVEKIEVPVVFLFNCSAILFPIFWLLANVQFLEALSVMMSRLPPPQ